MKPYSYWNTFLILASLKSFAYSADLNNNLPDFEAEEVEENISDSNNSRGSQSSKRSFLMTVESDHAVILNDNDLVFWIVTENFGQLASSLKHTGLEYSSELVKKVIDSAFELESSIALYCVKDENDVDEFHRVLFKKTIAVDSVFGINFLRDDDFEFDCRALSKLVRGDAIRAFTEVLEQFEDLAAFEQAQNENFSFLFDAKSARMVQVLIEAGSSTNVMNDAGLTPFRHYWHLQSWDIIRSLSLSHRAQLLREILKSEVRNAERALITIDRERVFSSAYEAVRPNCKLWYESKVEFNVGFVGETLAGEKKEVITGSGPLHEFISLVLDEMFSAGSENQLFEPIDESTFLYKPIRGTDKLKLRFAGGILALALRENIPLGITFIPLIQKNLLKMDVTFEDLKDQDPLFYKNIVEIRDNPDYDFEAYPHHFISDQDLEVTRENFNEFIADIVSSRLVNPFESEVTAFLSGFNEKTQFLEPEKIFDSQDFSLLLMGRVNIEAKDFEPCFQDDLHPHSRQFFLKFFEESDFVLRRRILTFITGLTSVPFDGISSLNVKIALTVYGMALEDLLPRSSTCIKTLYLAPIPDYETFKTKFMTTLDAPLLFGLN